MSAPRPRILVVDDDVGMRRLVRTGLELEGFTVIEAATLAQARSVEAERVDGVVLDRELPDGDGLVAYEELRGRYDAAVVVMHSASFVPSGYPSVPKGDIDALVELFGLVAAPAPHHDRAPDVARAAAERIVDEWVELCRWDPELPADDEPPIPGSVVAAVTAALERPQPLGWGLDPALESTAEAYGLNQERLDVAVTQLVCLREAFERQVVDRLPADEQLEAARRLTMIVHRLMAVVVRAGVADLQTQAFTDAVTGFGNERAFELDLRRERARAARHGRALTVARLSVEGIDVAIGGDEALRQAARALRTVEGTEVLAYRVGLSQFAVLLPDVVPVDPEFLRAALVGTGIRNAAVGIATHPFDPIDDLEQLAERRMRATPLPSRQRIRQQGGSDL